MGKLKHILGMLFIFLKNSIIAILKGKFLLRLNVSRYFVHILYVFFLFSMVIWISLMIDTTMNKVQQNEAALKELEIEHAQKTSELVSLSRRSSVGRMLQSLGSKLGEPDKPASVLKK